MSITPWLGVFLAVGVGTSTAAQGQVGQRQLTGVVERELSGPMVFGPPPTIDSAPRFSPAGDRLVYQAELFEETGTLVVSASSDPDLPAVVVGETEADVRGTLWTADGSRIVYWTQYELFVAPADGSLPALRLQDGPGIGGGFDLYDVTLSRSGTRVLYERQNLLWSVPLTGGPPVSVSGATSILSFESAPGGMVLFSRTNQAYSAPEDASSPPLLLAAARAVLDSTGQRAVYKLDNRLWSVPLDLGAPTVPLTPPLPGFALLFEHAVSPTSERVLFRADALVDDEIELFTARTDGSSSAAFELALDVAAGSDVQPIDLLTPDGTRVLCRTIGPAGPDPFYFSAFCVSFDGSSVVPILANAFEIGFGPFDLKVTPDSAHMVLRNESAGLFSFPLSGGTFQFVATASEEFDDYVLTATEALFGRNVADAPYALHRATIRPFAFPSPIRLSDPLVAPGSVREFVPSPDGASVAFPADRRWERLFRAELSGDPDTRPYVLPGPLDERGDVLEYRARSGRVVYVADQDEDRRYELFGVPADRSEPPIRLSGPLGIEGSLVVTGPYAAPTGAEIHLTPDGSRAVYLAEVGGSWIDELFSVATDGITPPVELNLPLLSGTSPSSILLTPNGARVVSIGRTSSGYGLHSTPVAGGSTVTLATLSSESVVYQISPDSTRVVFLDGALLSIPIAGGVATDLGGGATSIVDFEIAADSSRVVFRGGSSELKRLYSTPLAGGTRVTLATSAQAFSLTEDGSRALYEGKAFGPSGFDERLFSAPVGGGTSTLLHDLSGVLDSYVARGSRVLVHLVGADHALSVASDGSGSVALPPADDERLSPDGELVALRQADTVLVQPATGGALAALVTAPGLALVDFTPDGRRVIVRNADGSLDAFPVSGGPRRRLVSPAVRFASRLEFLGPDRWLYLGERDDPGTVELYTSGIERLGPP